MENLLAEVGVNMGRFPTEAAGAVAHNSLVIAYFLLIDGTTDEDLGQDSFARRDAGQLQRRLNGRPDALGPPGDARTAAAGGVARLIERFIMVPRANESFSKAQQLHSIEEPGYPCSKDMVFVRETA